jgi:hypothetical protein
LERAGQLHALADWIISKLNVIVNGSHFSFDVCRVFQKQLYNFESLYQFT